MINQVALTGRLTREVDLRYTQGGTAVASFTLAVDRNFTNAQGERESDFINCVIWRKSAENFSNFTRKGSLVGVQGRLQARSYDNAQGQRVFVTEVVVDNFALLESRATTEARPRGEANGNGNNSFNNQGGYNNGSNNGSYQNQNQNQQRPQGGSGAAPANSGNQGMNNNGGSNASDPFNNPDPFANSGKQIDISDDDLPF